MRWTWLQFWVAVAFATFAGCGKVVPDSSRLDLPESAAPAQAVPAAAEPSAPIDDAATASGASSTPSSSNSAGLPAPRTPKVAVAVTEEEDPNVYEPTVILSEAHAATCVVKVGDEMPALVLRDLDGNAQPLADLRGEKLTIVVFWTARQALAKELYQRLGIIAADRYSGSGVNVAAINVGDDAETVKTLNAQFGGSFPCLLDPNGEAFSQVATAKLPRVYLLDPSGRILWFDLENSRGMRRRLHNAVRFHLGEGRGADVKG